MANEKLSNLLQTKAMLLLVPACLQIWQGPDVPVTMLTAAALMLVGIMLKPKG